MGKDLGHKTFNAMIIIFGVAVWTFFMKQYVLDERYFREVGW